MFLLMLRYHSIIDLLCDEPRLECCSVLSLSPLSAMVFFPLELHRERLVGKSDQIIMVNFSTFGF